MEIEEPLDFEFDDPLVPTPPPGKTKRKKIIDLDDLLNDHYKEENKITEKNIRKKTSKFNNSDEDEDKNQKKERELSKLVNDCHKQVHEMGHEVDVPLWGVKLFGSQKQRSQLNFKEPERCRLLQTLSHDKATKILNVDIKEGGGFLEGLLKNGWLLKLVHACGYLEASVASWTFQQMLYSSKEELRSSACDFWCSILVSDMVEQPSLRLEWFPNYSELKCALDVYGYLYSCCNYSSSPKLDLDGSILHSGLKGPPLNIKYWVKFVAVIFRSRRALPTISVSEVEELLSLLLSFFLDRQLQGIIILLDECVRSVLSFFSEEEWQISSINVANSIACSIPKDLNCLRIVECISLGDSRSKNLRSKLAIRIFIQRFDKQVSDPKEILELLASTNIKEKDCDLVKQYIYLVLIENWLCWDPPLADKSTVLNIWYKFLRNCSLQITSTDWRPYASKVRNRASYLLQTANPEELYRMLL